VNVVRVQARQDLSFANPIPYIRKDLDDPAVDQGADLVALFLVGGEAAVDADGDRDGAFFDGDDLDAGGFLQLGAQADFAGLGFGGGRLFGFGGGFLAAAREQGDGHGQGEDRDGFHGRTPRAVSTAASLRRNSVKA